MKYRRLRKPIRIALYALATVVLLYGMLIAFVVGVADSSFRYAPPTVEELAENPELERIQYYEKQ